MKLLVKTIMKSRTYQLSAQPNDFNKDDGKYFSHAVTKLLTGAEQLLDAICDFTAVPEKFAGLPAGTRADAAARRRGEPPVPEGVRPTPARELACECERESDGNLAQALATHQRPDGQREGPQRDQPPRRSCWTRRRRTTRVLAELYYAALGRRRSMTRSKSRWTTSAKREDKRKAWKTWCGRSSTPASSCSGTRRGRIFTTKDTKIAQSTQKNDKSLILSYSLWHFV